jgi:hypothetical protein
MEITNHDIVTDLIVRRIQGGIREFQRTGVYPDNIIFSSWQLGKSWKQKMKTDNQLGNVKMNGSVIFNYRLIEDHCEIQMVTGKVPMEVWIRKEISITMCD